MSNAMVKPSGVITEAVTRRLDQEDALRQIATQSTPKNEIRVRQGRGGQQLKYTDGAYVIRTLNKAFGWDWDFVADNEELLTNNGKPFEVKVRGSLTVRFNEKSVTKTQYGCQPIEFLRNGEAPVSIGDAYKGAATDAMKKCASLLGIALDLYDSDYRADKYADSEPEPPPPVAACEFCSSAPSIGLRYGKPICLDCSAKLGSKNSDHGPEPVRPVVLEGAQPTSAEWPKGKGIGAAIFAKCKALGFSPTDLANYIQLQFKLAVSDEPQSALDALDNMQLKALDQALAGEFNNRGAK